MLHLQVGTEIDQRAILRKLVDMRYERNDMNLVRGKFRVRGDTIEVHPAYDETAVRIELFGDEIERIQVVDPLTGEQVDRARRARRSTRPRTTSPATSACGRPSSASRQELQERLACFEKEGKLLEAQRLRMRTQYDLEMMQEVGYCNGIENYSAPLDGRAPGRGAEHAARLLPRRLPAGDRREPPVACRSSTASTRATAPARSSSSSTASGSRARPTTGRCGSRRSSSGSTRWCSCRPRPGPFELQVSTQVVEQIVRPTGLVDPEVIVKPTKGQIDDLIEQINGRIASGRPRARHHPHQEDGRGPHRLPARAGPPGPLPPLERRHHPAHRDPPRPAPGRVRRAGRHQPAAGGPRPARGVAGGDPRRRQGGLPPLARRRSSRRSAGPPATSTAR